MFSRSRCLFRQCHHMLFRKHVIPCHNIIMSKTNSPSHETESPWPIHFKHSHWWKRRSRSKVSSHYAWGTTGVRECKMDVKFLHGIVWIMFNGHLDYFQRPPLGGRPHIELGDHITPNTHNRWFFIIIGWWWRDTQISRKRLAVQLPVVNSSLYLTEYLPSGQLSCVLWC